METYDAKLRREEARREGLELVEDFQETQGTQGTQDSSEGGEFLESPASLVCPESLVYPESPVFPSLLRAFTKSLPRKAIETEAQLDKAVFRLCRHIAAVPDLHRSPAGMRAIARDWVNRAKQVMVLDRRGAEVSALDGWTFDQIWISFSSALDKVREPAGSIFEEIAEQARVSPPHPAADLYEDPALRLLVSLCYQLQLYHGDEPFFLGVTEAQEFLGTSRKTAWKMLQTLKTDSIIKKIRDHDFGRHRATEWRFISLPE
jgi:hypothetical protein